MMIDNLRKALNRIVVTRDFSLDAASALESVIATSFADDPRFEELQHHLASYQPGGGGYLYNEKQLEDECRKVLELL